MSEEQSGAAAVAAMQRGTGDGGTLRVAGCDLGKGCAKLVVAEIDEGGALRLVSAEAIEHGGRPLEIFADWYRRAGVASVAALGATGLHAAELVAPVLSGLPEDGCLSAALDQHDELAGAVNLVTVGARGYGVLTRDSHGRVRYLENDKCSSGTGETMVKIAGRFGLTVPQADELACAAERAIAITARCSVFAKSEMTHFGNQGRPREALFRGYFESVASYACALLARARVDGPVFLVGGGSRLGALRRGLECAAGQPIRVPERALLLEAIGAAVLAAEQARAGTTAPLPADPAELVLPRQKQFRVLAPASDHASRVTRLSASTPEPGAAQQPCVLGLDLGSTGSKAVLTRISDGELVLDCYDRTRGNPVDAARRLLSTLLDRTQVDVRAIGVTGSGREAVATVLRAVYPQRQSRIVVINEIVAHATAAIRCDPDGGDNLSVVEIGGQDAKFIQIAGGQIVESDMNKACSAGTGSFLEEQAVFYGIDDIADFTALAKQATRPPDLGQMCTVFVADAAAEAHGQGFERADLFGGFQYAVIHNYINRVMGQRSFGRRIFFQGKPATGASLGWTLAAVTGREVLVPPNPGAMGAWGIGLCAIEQLGAEALAAGDAFDLHAVGQAQVVGRSELQCRDKGCATYCNIQRTTVQVGDRQHQVMSGGACPKFEISSAAKPKLDKGAPSAFDERAAALAPYLAERSGARMVAVPQLGACYGVVPWLVTLLAELGLGVKVLRSSKGSLARGEQRCFSFDACAPAKIAHGAIEGEVDTVVMPKLLWLNDRDGAGGPTCPMEQGLPELIRESLRARGSSIQLVHPTLSLAEGLSGLGRVAEVAKLAARLGADLLRVPRAMAAADDAQCRYEAELGRIGQRSLEYGRDHRLDVVAVCGSLHVIHDPAVNASIPALLREGGVLPLPMDCYPIGAEVPQLGRVAWADANRTLRTAVAARGRGGVYPLLLTAFGCGPASFTEQFFSALMDGYPHTVLESDGHGGAAGYVTRVQAFLYAVRRYHGGPSRPLQRRLRLLEKAAGQALEAEPDAQLVTFTAGDRIGPILAAAYRSFGFDAVPAALADAETLALGRRDCSGKECLPYQLLWGGFRSHLEQDPTERRTLLMQVSGDGKCRNCMFAIKDELSLERLGLSNRVATRIFDSNSALGFGRIAKVWTGVTLWDLMFQLAAYYRPLESEPGQVDRLYAGFCDEIEALTERPIKGGLAAVATVSSLDRAVMELVERASESFASLGQLGLRARRASRRRTESNGRRTGGQPLRTVLLSGDIYVRIDRFANDDLIKRLNRRGLLVVVEPTWVLSEYFAGQRLGELLGLPTGLLDNAIVRVAMRLIRRRIYKRARRLHPWLPDVDSGDLIEASRDLLDTHPQGEAPVTLGSVLKHWHERACDGVVVASPWGCAPALVSESLLRHQRDIPMLFVYADGSPIDDRRLGAFAFRLHRAEPRCQALGPSSLVQPRAGGAAAGPERRAQQDSNLRPPAS